MIKLIFLTLALFAASISVSAQVKVAGYPYVPSTTSSNTGLAIVTLSGAGSCDIPTQTNCTVTTAQGGAFSNSLLYVLTYVIEGNDADPLVSFPSSPGRTYQIVNKLASSMYAVGDSPGSWSATISVGSSLTLFLDNSMTQVYSPACLLANAGYYIPETNDGLCQNSPLDDGVVNPGFLSSSKKMNLPSGTVGVTQMAGDSSTQLATDQFVANSLPLSGPPYSLGTCTTAATITPANGSDQTVTLTAGDTCALSFTQPTSGRFRVTVKITQASTPTGAISTTAVNWPTGTTPTITTTANAVDFISCYLDGTNTYCVPSQNFAL